MNSLPLITRINNYNYSINGNIYDLYEKPYIINICDLLDDKFNYIKSNFDDIEENNNNLRNKLEIQIKQNENNFKIINNTFLWLVFSYLILVIINILLFNNLIN